MMKPLFFLLILAFISSSAQSRSTLPRPYPLPEFKINTNQTAGKCLFVVSITTSCSSTKYTRDRVSISFGDAYGNQAYAPRIDYPPSGTFAQCSTNMFQIKGPCTSQICYLYLYRSGNDGWIPSDVTVFGISTDTVTFYYNVTIPGDMWYGVNECNYGTRAASLATE